MSPPPGDAKRIGGLGRPAAGVRFVLERSDDGLAYRGHAHRPDADVRIEVRVGADGACSGSGDDPALAKQAAALVRAAVKAPLAAGRVPPRRIVRWRDA